ncbi:MAG: hypothetical protein EPO20_30535 [Betaproteobacteria bacterium]|nr:MAG: hypothetical protein EPO20_30535 [Betaproteobacteria bacterium]
MMENGLKVYLVAIGMAMFVGGALSYLYDEAFVIPDKLSTQCTQLGFEWDKEKQVCGSGLWIGLSACELAKTKSEIPIYFCNVSSPTFGEEVKVIVEQEPKQQPHVRSAEEEKIREQCIASFNCNPIPAGVCDGNTYGGCIKIEQPQTDNKFVDKRQLDGCMDTLTSNEIRYDRIITNLLDELKLQELKIKSCEAKEAS